MASAFVIFSKARRNPSQHAVVLLKETALPFDEIANITGLSIYKNRWHQAEITQGSIKPRISNPNSNGHFSLV